MFLEWIPYCPQFSCFYVFVANVALCSLSFLVGILLISLVAVQCDNVAHNITTNESVNFDRYSYLLSSGGEGFFNRNDEGLVKNCCSFLSSSRYSRDTTTHGGGNEPMPEPYIV